MNKGDVEKIINEEQLVSYSFFEDRDDASDEMVIKNKSGKYVVYATNERAAKVVAGESIFEQKSDALDDFIRRLRGLNKVRRLYSLFAHSDDQ